MSNILYTCHEGCDSRIWNLCGGRIHKFATLHCATLEVLSKSKLRNPQWVLFDAMRSSLDDVYNDDDKFAWIDSDVVVMDKATDIWTEYPNSLTLCPNASPLNENLIREMGLSSLTCNICTGVVRWDKKAASQIIEWLDQNIDTLPKIATNRTGDLGDQEVLIMALNETQQRFSFFHPKMHVAGARPPVKTAFKHKGGGNKLSHIQRFIEINKKWENRTNQWLNFQS